MRWQGREKSVNIEDRRGRGGFRRPSGGRPLKGPGGLVVLLIVLAAGYYGIDLSPLLDVESGSGQSSGFEQPYQPSAQEQMMADFSAVALKMTEEAWANIFRSAGQQYQPPKMVLYTGQTSTTCGYGQAAMGPFYCPGDRTVYLDLSFFQDMRSKYGGGGDFAQGYVIAHEVGHHVQNILGIEAEVRKSQRNSSRAEANRLSVKMELQADCFAGVWGRHVQQEGLLDPGDVEQALKTAEAIGDDRLQRESGGRVVPDSFTHGTSAQRHMWFKRGFDSGSPEVCDTFSQ
ncbi:neutral zinc metallopeptidase [Deltaproteobacteria bacterium OttesenSCG-928-K17]|nr:neutral zinc metallopeptidase [Deltaproteobacteria bacterium OttesenSCG-928-K17]